MKNKNYQKLGGIHFIFIPGETAKTKSLYLSTFTFRLLMMGLIFIVPLVFASFAIALHYQNAFESLKNQTQEEKQLASQKNELEGRLFSIEQTLVESESKIAGFASALDIETGKVKSGLGPLEVDLVLDSHSVKGTQSEPDFFEEIEAPTNLTVAALKGRLGDVEKRILGLDSNLKEIFELHKDKIRFLNASPDDLPLDGWVTSGFGYRRSPYSGVYRMHYGIDIAAPMGVPIRAPSDGKVLHAAYEPGYGNMVVLDHGYGVATVYGHASSLFVKDGGWVKKGDEIARVGSTGSSTGPHLHYEIHVDGIPTNPLVFVGK